MQESDKFSISTEDGSLGIFTTVAFILLLWGFCWLKSYAPFQSKQYINVMFKEVAGLHGGAPVFVNGVKSGVVDSVTWKNSNQVLVHLSITHAHMVIPQGAQFNILANGIIGARYLDIVMPNANAELQQPIDESMIVIGGTVSRPELVLDKIGRDIDKIDIDRIKESLSEDGKALRHAANQVSTLADKTMPVMDRALPLESNLNVMSSEIRKTLNKLNNFADNPHLSSELRETVDKARETAQIAQETIHVLNNMVNDKSLRHDIGETMNHLNQSTAMLESSMEKVQQVSRDKDLRSDVKQILLDARKALDKLDKVLGDPDSGADVRATLKHTRVTLSDIDIAARQLQQILDKRHPLIHMFLGRPGHIKTEEVEKIDQ